MCGTCATTSHHGHRWVTALDAVSHLVALRIEASDLIAHASEHVASHKRELMQLLQRVPPASHHTRSQQEYDVQQLDAWCASITRSHQELRSVFATAGDIDALLSHQQYCKNTNTHRYAHSMLQCAVLLCCRSAQSIRRHGECIQAHHIGAVHSTQLGT